jgi:hypothetical protein
MISLRGALGIALMASVHVVGALMLFARESAEPTRRSECPLPFPLMQVTRASERSIQCFGQRADDLLGGLRSTTKAEEIGI